MFINQVKVLKPIINTISAFRVETFAIYQKNYFVHFVFICVFFIFYFCLDVDVHSHFFSLVLLHS